MDLGYILNPHNVQPGSSNTNSPRPYGEKTTLVAPSSSVHSNENTVSTNQRNNHLNLLRLEI